jgi:hypothetical protein
MTITPTKKKPEAPPSVAEVDPLLRRPIPHAYALVPHPERPGLYYSVHLTNVTAEAVEHLDLNGRPSLAPMGMVRIGGAMQRRHFEKKWG